MEKKKQNIIKIPVWRIALTIIVIAFFTGIFKVKGSSIYSILTNKINDTKAIRIVGEEAGNDDVKIVSAKIIDVKDGTPVWDDNDTEPGNDSSDSNKRIRTFDNLVYNIGYTMEVANDNYISYKEAKVYLEVTIEYPSSLVKFDLASMSWLQDANIKEDGGRQTLTGYRYAQIGNAEVAVPGAGTLPITLIATGLDEGNLINPEFKVYALSNKEDIKTLTYDPIYVTCTYGLDAIVYEVGEPVVPRTTTHLTTYTSLDNESFTGAAGYFQLYLTYKNKNDARGIKGIKPIKENDTVQITVSLEGKFTNQDGNLYDNDGTYFINFAKSNVPEATINYELADGKMIITYKSNAVQNGISHATFNDVVFTVEIDAAIKAPSAVINGWKNATITTLNSNTGIKIDDFKLNNNIFEQTVTTNDNFSENCTIYPIGGIAKETYIFSEQLNTDNTLGFLNSQMPFLGENKIVKGNKFITRNSFYAIMPPEHISKLTNQKTEICIAKFDGNLKPGSIEEIIDLNTRLNEGYSLYTSAYGYSSRTVKNATPEVWYVATKNNQNWTSDQELTQSVLLEEIKSSTSNYYLTKDESKKIVAVLFMYKNIEPDIQHLSAGEVRLYGEVYIPLSTDSSEKNKAYQVNTEWYCSSKTVSSIDDISTDDMNYFIMNKKYKTYAIGRNNQASGYTNNSYNFLYEKTAYDQNGIVTGGHTNGYQSGNTIYVVGADQKIEKHIAQVDNSGNELRTFDLANTNKIDFKIQPSVFYPEGIEQISDNKTFVILTDVIPKNSTFIDSIVQGGTYQMTDVDRNIGNLTGGNQLLKSSATVTDYSTAVSNLTNGQYAINDDTIYIKLEVTPGEKIEPIYYSVTVPNDVEFASYVTTTNINCPIGNGGTTIYTAEGESPTSASVGFTTISMKDIRLNKKVNKIYVEQNEKFEYEIALTNISQYSYNDATLLDILPYDGDLRGTKFSGTYEAKEFKLSGVTNLS